MKKSNLIILALVLINLILSVVLVFTVVPSLNKTTKLIDKICQIVDLNVGADNKGNDEDNVGIEDLDNKPVTFNGDANTTVPFASGKGENVHYARVGVTITLNKKSEDYANVSKNFESLMSNIDNVIIDVIGSYHYDEYDKAKISADILAKLQELFSSKCVYGVSFTEWTVQ